jgi:hypothetical protein
MSLPQHDLSARFDHSSNGFHEHSVPERNDFVLCSNAQCTRTKTFDAQHRVHERSVDLAGVSI